VCLALPFYLRKKNILRTTDALFSAAALVILGAVLGFSVFPIPPAPLKYLPYVFILIISIGVAFSLRYLRRGQFAVQQTDSLPR
jgi:uncharacterized membrane protein YfcA